MPMTILDVNTGKPIMNFSFEKNPETAEFEFLEQYNHSILIKYKDKPLEIVDVLTKEKKVFPMF